MVFPIGDDNSGRTTTPVVNYICDVTGLPRTAPITLPSGRTVTAEQAKRDYAHLFRQF